MQAIIYALMTSVAFGIGNVLTKSALTKGMHADGFIFSCGVTLVLISIPTLCNGGIQNLFPNSTTMWLGAVSGILCALGLKFELNAFAMSTSLISVIIVLAAMHPLISSSIIIPFMGEGEKLHVIKFFAGVVGMMVSCLLVITSIK